MPDSIRRVNYHTGLFLEEPEFKMEQDYHRLLQRRLNYGFLDPGILRGLELEYDGSSPSVTVKPGIAVSHDTNVLEGKEILVSNDFPLSLSGFSSGATVYIVLSHDEVPGPAKAPTNLPATTIEVAKIEAVLSTTFTPDPDLKIVLGQITIGTPVISPIPGRKMAQIRSELLPGPTLTPGIAIFPPTVAAGTTATLTVTATGGFDLSGIGTSNVSISGNGISNIAVPSNTGVQMQVSFVIDPIPTTTPGSRTITVTKGPITVSDTFNITPGLTLSSFQGVNIPNGITHITLIGTGFSAPVSVEFSIAGGAFSPPISVTTPNVTSTQIKIDRSLIPANAEKGKVRVTVPGNPPINSSFDFVPPAEIKSFDNNPFSRTTHKILIIAGERFYSPANIRFTPYTDSASRLSGSAPGSFPDSTKDEKIEPSTIKVVPPTAAQSNGKVRVETPGGIVESVDNLIIFS